METISYPKKMPLSKCFENEKKKPKEYDYVWQGQISGDVAELGQNGLFVNSASFFFFLSLNSVPMTTSYLLTNDHTYAFASRKIMTLIYTEDLPSNVKIDYF